MKKIIIILSLIAGMALISSVAFAANNGQGKNSASAQANGNANANSHSKSATASQVPQAQIDRVQKREEMNQRRAEMLIIRQQLIDSDNPGNVDGQQTNQ